MPFWLNPTVWIVILSTVGIASSIIGRFAVDNELSMKQTAQHLGRLALLADLSLISFTKLDGLARWLTFGLGLAVIAAAPQLERLLLALAGIFGWWQLLAASATLGICLDFLHGEGRLVMSILGPVVCLCGGDFGRDLLRQHPPQEELDPEKVDYKNVPAQG